MADSIDLSASRQANLYAADIITFFAAVVAVGLRVWSRRVAGAGLWLDDLFICIALVGGVAMMTNFCWWIPNGFGKHMEAFGPKAEYNFFLGFFMAEVIYTVIIVFVKYSILALYWRVFRSTSIKWPVAILAAIVTSWGIAVLFLSIFTCVPPKGFWDKDIHASCNVNSQQFLIGISVPNILTDVALLLLPIPYVLRLNTAWSQKRLLMGTFLLGGFVCIASIMRLISVWQQNSVSDFSWNWVNQGIWAVVESNFAIVSACLPTLRIVWVCLFRRKKNATSPPSSDRPAIWTIGSGPSKQNRKRKGELTLGESMSTDSTHPFTSLHDAEEGNISVDKVHVRSSIEVHSERDTMSSPYRENFNMVPLKR
ncbi:uncharacterized protein EAF02_011233 [Botrytis sinoallii]|uniref:uncharacterized protein n=1 Tax=Botrytis sinoallii TaxID=1463999 RepID=UPI001900CC46|nr:uncharacterized protein EAF02_011233 [Botrytis sinoallii]KAF7857866.1 hypothetical protein EAF02_011233 [Botrytis sinoallii]